MWCRTGERSSPDAMSSIASSRPRNRPVASGSRGASPATRPTVHGRRLVDMPDARGSAPNPGDPSDARRIRVFLLDDHEVVRRGLRELLESEDDIEVVGEAGTAEEATTRIPPTR